MGDQNDCQQLDDELYEVLRIEAGIPKHGVDMDENDCRSGARSRGLVSYNKGCYIGQEIIARIHFRGHVAKQGLTGVTLSGTRPVGSVPPRSDMSTPEGKPAGKITSITSSHLNRHIALAYVRYHDLAPGTELSVDGVPAIVTQLPFIQQK